jgi:DNA-binding MarR family transcriptional regulator
MTNERRELVAELTQSYKDISQLFLRNMQTMLNDLPDCHPGSLAVLKVVGKHGPMSQHAIAQELFHSDAAVSRQVTMLLEKGYVHSEVATENRRTSMISLTDAGRKLLVSVQSSMNDYLAQLLRDVPDNLLLDMIATNRRLQHLLVENGETV